MNAEQTEVNLLVVGAFEKLGLRYFLGGSMASSAHGFYRATNDADFIVNLRSEHVTALLGLLAGLFYADESAIRQAVATGRSFNLIHLETLLKVDVFPLKTDPFSSSQMNRRVLLPIGREADPQMYLASAEDTVLSKLLWYRAGGYVSDRQWSDIQGVLKVQGERLDLGYLRHWAKELGLTDLLTRAFEDAGIPSTQ